MKLLLKIDTLTHWYHAHQDTIVVTAGGLSGAFWNVWNDLTTIQSIEGFITVGIRAFIGASIARIVQCIYLSLRNYFLNRKKKQT